MLAKATVNACETAVRSPNGAQLAFSSTPLVAFADMRAVWCITHRAAALSNARSAPKTTGSRRTAICRGHCLCCRDSCKEPKWGPAGVFRPGTQWVDLRDAKSMAGKYFSQKAKAVAQSDVCGRYALYLHHMSQAELTAPSGSEVIPI